jgi:hypothetical protein
MSDIPKDTEAAEADKTPPVEPLTPKAIAAIQNDEAGIAALQARVEKLKVETEAREAAERAQLQTPPQDAPLPAPPQPKEPEPPPTPPAFKEKEREPTIERPSSAEGA